MKEDRAGEEIACLALVQTGGDATAQQGVLQPLEREKRAFNAANLT